MKVLFAFSHVGVFRHYEGVVRALCKEGAEVTVLTRNVVKPNITDRALRACRSEVEGFGFGWLQERNDMWFKPLSYSRETLNYLHYLRPGHPSPGLGKRWLPYLPRPVRMAVKNSRLQRVWQAQSVATSLRRIERLAPPSKQISDWLVREDPDVVVGSPLIMDFSVELEYIKAAKALDIPTVGAVASWDNLTTKGIFHVLPDQLLVWNQALAEEAVKLHAIPEEKLAITGAPTFDYWFEMRPTVDREAFCRQAGVDSKRRFVVYLSSSTTIAGNEAPYVKEFAAALSDNPDTRDLTILVRPHPLNSAIWEKFEAENIVVWPKNGDVPDMVDIKQDYIHTLAYSSAIVGVNTSAMLEAAIMDKPCITIMTADYKKTQSEMGHFHHLLRGDFLEIANSFTEAAQTIKAVVDGRDAKADNRRRFVREFIRPLGLKKSASTAMAEAIYTAAARKTGDEAKFEKCAQLQSRAL